jgi:hypothetical protein
MSASGYCTGNINLGGTANDFAFVPSTDVYSVVGFFIFMRKEVEKMSELHLKKHPGKRWST